MRRIDLIVIHCSATRENRSFPVTSLIACHQARFGFTGYHYYITRDGQTYQTRHENLVGAHARHYNKHSIGVCYEGGLDANVNVLFSAKSSEVPVFAGIFRFQQNVRFSRFNIWYCY